MKTNGVVTLLLCIMFGQKGKSEEHVLCTREGICPEGWTCSKHGRCLHNNPEVMACSKETPCPTGTYCYYQHGYCVNVWFGIDTSDMEQKIEDS
ncbi:hypothetical protein L9F63_011426, partial [Diploptera punctata]